MLPIAHLLERFKGITNTEKARKELIIQEVHKFVPGNLLHTQVTISRNFVQINSNPIIKTEILLNKEEILKGIQSHKNLSFLLDIR